MIGQANEAKANQWIEDACNAVMRRVDKPKSSGGKKKSSKSRRSESQEAQATLAAASGFTAAEDRQLMAAMRALLDAAEHYSKARIPGASVRCAALAALVA